MVKKKITKLKNNATLRRGFKLCAGCKSEIHIHKKVCPNCQYEHEFKVKAKSVKMNADIAQKIVECKNKKMPKRYQESIYVIKKSILYSDKTNKDTILLDSLKQQHIEYDLGKNTYFELKPKEFIYQGVKFQSNKLIDDLMYIGYPIMAMDMNELCLAVSIQNNNYENQQFSQLHKPGIIYKGVGIVLIYPMPFNGQYGLIKHDEGCITKLKFHPFNQLIGSLNANGSFVVFPYIANTSQTMANIIYKTEGTFTSFDWNYGQQNIVALGDHKGTLWIYKLKQNSEMDLINLLEGYHFGPIRAMEFYKHNDGQMGLLLTGGYDGNVKILDPSQSTPCLDINVSSKGVLNVSWDIGGKFVLILKDELYHRAQLMSFFSVMREKDSIQTLQGLEQRFIQSLSGDDHTIALHSNGDHVYFTSNRGLLFQAEQEQVRKQAIKKEKKQTYHSNLLHEGSISIVNNIIHYSAEADTDQSKIQLGDWFAGYQYISSNTKSVVIANILGILVVKTINS